MPITLSPTLNPASGTRSAPLAIAFSVVPTGGVAPYSYHWVFGDGNTSVLASGTHTYVGGRSYPVSLAVTDSVGATASWSDTYVVNPPVTATFTAVVTLGPGSANSVAFTSTVDLGTAPYTYAWDFGDGQTSTAANPTHVYAEAGSYNVTLVVTDAAARTVTVSNGVGISIAMSVVVTAVPVLGSVPLVVNFTATASAGSAPYVYTWEFGDGTIASGAAVSHTYDTPGVYQVKVGVVDALLHDTGGGLVLTVLKELKIDPASFPEKGITPLAVSFYARQTGGEPPYQYLWNFGDGTTSTEKDPVHVFRTAGNPSVTLTVTDGLGRGVQSSIAADINVNPIGAASASIYDRFISVFYKTFTIFGR